MPVDFPGPCNNNIKGLQGRSKWTKNADMYSNYLFVFAFHNSLDNANIDEKFEHDFNEKFKLNFNEKFESNFDEKFEVSEFTRISIKFKTNQQGNFSFSLL